MCTGIEIRYLETGYNKKYGNIVIDYKKIFLPKCTPFTQSCFPWDTSWIISITLVYNNNCGNLGKAFLIDNVCYNTHKHIHTHTYIHMYLTAPQHLHSEFLYENNKITIINTKNNKQQPTSHTVMRLSLEKGRSCFHLKPRIGSESPPTTCSSLPRNSPYSNWVFSSEFSSKCSSEIFTLGKQISIGNNNSKSNKKNQRFM